MHKQAQILLIQKQRAVDHNSLLSILSDYFFAYRHLRILNNLHNL